MSYSQRLHANGGEFKSHLTGKVYKFSKTPDHSSRRRAIAELQRDEKAVREANNTRAESLIGRQLTEREHLSNDWLPETRSRAEQIRQDAVHTTQPQRSDDDNVFAPRAQQLREWLGKERDPNKRAQIQERLALAEAASERFDQQLAERKAWEARLNAPEVQTARVLAESWVVLLRVSRHSESQFYLQQAQSLLKQLQETGDHEAAHAGIKELESAYDSKLRAKADSLAADAKEIQEQAKSVRTEAATKPPEQPGELAASE